MRAIAFTGAMATLLVSLGVQAAPVGSEGIGLQPLATTINVSPSSGLLDGATLTVTGADFDPSTAVYIRQCATDSALPLACGGSAASPVTPDAGGAFSAPVIVDRLLYSGLTPTDCATPGLCRIVVAAPNGTTLAAEAIQFDPSIPPPPGPSIQVVPATNLVDGQVVAINGSGFPPSVPNQVPDMLQIVQCRAGAMDSASCDLSHVGKYTWVMADGSGAVSAQQIVRRSITTGSGVIDCGVAPGCEILLGEPFTQAGVAVSPRAPIQFRSLPAVAGAVGLTPAFTG